MNHKFITDEAVEAAWGAMNMDALTEREELLDMRRAIAAFVAHHEGERPCERCKDGTSGKRWAADTCAGCRGTGKQREDRLVKLSEVVALVDDHVLEKYDVCDNLRRAIIRKFGGDR